MTQFGRPVADPVTGGWSGGANLFGEIDEVSASEADLIETGNNPSNDVCEVDLTTSLGDPLSSSTHIVRYRYKKHAAAGRTIELRVRLLQGGAGGTQIAIWTHSDIGETIVQADNTLSSGEADSITDYTDLSLEFRGNTSGGGAARKAQVSWAVLEIPDAAGFIEGAVAIAGSAVITVAPQMLYTAAAAIAGSAEITVAAQMLYAAAAAIEGSGAVVVSGGLVLAGGVAISGSGEITVQGVRGRTGAVAIQGSAEITAIAQMILAGDVAIAGSGNITVLATALREAAVAIGGSGEATISGSISGGLVREGAANISAGAEVSVSGVVIQGDPPFFENWKVRRTLNSRGELILPPVIWLHGSDIPQGNLEPARSANIGSMYSQHGALDDAAHVWLKIDDDNSDSDWQRIFVQGAALVSNADFIAAAGVVGSKLATNARRRIIVSKEFDIDNGAGSTDDNIMLLPSVGVTVIAARVAYTEATDSDVAGSANVRLGTSIGGGDIVAAAALQTSKPVGGITDLTLVSGDTPVAANGFIAVRHTGVAATEAGKYKIILEILVDD